MRGDETVLVVEDDPRVRAVTVRALEVHGYRVLPAGSGEEALALARESSRRIDLVVTDVVMPGMSGREVVDELRRGLPGLPALFVSGYTQDAIAQRGVLDSGVEFLPKPFTPATLVARVRATLDRGVAAEVIRPRWVRPAGSSVRWSRMKSTTLVVALVCAACTRAPAPPAARAPEPGPDAGTVSVQIQPYGVEVVADGVVRCRTPCSFRIDPGLHRISVRATGFLPWQEDVRVDPRAQVNVSASLVGSH